jgi:Tfp pilus assembly ATPase PilU
MSTPKKTSVIAYQDVLKLVSFVNEVRLYFQLKLDMDTDEENLYEESVGLEKILRKVAKKV